MALFGEFFYDPTKWRQSVPFIEQLRAFQELIHEGKVIMYSLLDLNYLLNFLGLFNLKDGDWD